MIMNIEKYFALKERLFINNQKYLIYETIVFMSPVGDFSLFVCC